MSDLLVPSTLGDEAEAPAPSVLAFVADSESRAAVRSALARLDTETVVVETGNIRTAIERLGRERSPRLLIVDLEGSELPLSDVDELSEVCEPGVAVVALGRKDEVALFRALLDRGVADYFVKPVPPELLAASLQRVTQGHRAARHTTRLGRSVVTVGVRGGVGATTIACGLARLVSVRHHRRVALLDLDLHYGTVALSLDLDPVNGLRDALESPEGIDPLLVERLAQPLDDGLVAFAAETSPTEPVTVDPLAVEGVLDTLRHRYHYVVVDLPRGAGETFLQVVERTDVLLLVADLSLAAMRDTLRLSQLVARVNPAARTLVVANRVGWSKSGELDRTEFERGIGRPVDHVVPFDPTAVPAAVNTGRIDYAERGPVASALGELAESVTGRPAPKGGGLLRRLFRRRG